MNNRLLSDDGVTIDGLERTWLRYVAGGPPKVVGSMDRTNFDNDNHTTPCVYLVTRAGRALPLLWRTTKKSLLRDN
jgi:hypothetical protein